MSRRLRDWLFLLALALRPGSGRDRARPAHHRDHRRRCHTIPIAVVPFAGEANYPYPLTEIVGADLARSGLFRLIDPAGVNPRPTRAEDVRFGDWTGRGADAEWLAASRRSRTDRVEVRFFLLDAVKQTQLAAVSYVVTPSQFRATAHQIADVIYEKLTGDAGVFSTRIAYIAKQGPRYELLVADADGYNPQTIVTSNEPLLSPTWSPDGTRIAYVSLESKKPIIYVQSLATGQRHVLANFRGSNSAPAWAPDGSRLAVTLSRDGGSQLYLINPDGSGVQRLMTLVRHRYRGELCARRKIHPVHIGSRRQPADLSADARERHGGTDDLRRQLQRVAAASPGRQGLRIPAS